MTWARDGGGESGPEDTPGQDEPTSEDRPDNFADPLGELPVWSYCQTGPRRTSRTYTGHVTYVGGAEGKRLRRELAAVVRDLLEWASQRETRPQEGGDDE